MVEFRDIDLNINTNRWDSVTFTAPQTATDIQLFDFASLSKTIQKNNKYIKEPDDLQERLAGIKKQRAETASQSHGAAIDDTTNEETPEAAAETKDKESEEAEKQKSIIKKQVESQRIKLISQLLNNSNVSDDEKVELKESLDKFFGEAEKNAKFEEPFVDENGEIVKKGKTESGNNIEIREGVNGDGKPMTLKTITDEDGNKLTYMEIKHDDKIYTTITDAEDKGIHIGYDSSTDSYCRVGYTNGTEQVVQIYDPDGTSSGAYIADPSGEYIGYFNENGEFVKEEFFPSQESIHTTQSPKNDSVSTTPHENIETHESFSDISEEPIILAEDTLPEEFYVYGGGSTNTLFSTEAFDTKRY